MYCVLFVPYSEERKDEGVHNGRSLWEINRADRRWYDAYPSKRLVVYKRASTRNPAESRTSLESPSTLNKMAMCLINKIDRCLQDVIYPRKTQEQVMQQMRLNLDQSSLEMAEKL